MIFKKISVLCIIQFLTLLFFIPSSYSQVDIGLGLNFVSPNEYESIQFSKATFRGPLKESIDLSNKAPFPGFQGRQGSCVAWALAYCIRSYYEMVYEETNNSSIILTDTSTWNNVFSPAFIYNKLNQSRDRGITLVSALEFAKSIGVVKWSDMPYKDRDYLTQPHVDLFTKASSFKINDYKKVEISINEYKLFLNDGAPILIGVNIDSIFSYSGFKCEPSIPYIWKAFKGESLGGHALTIVGYDNKIKAFKIQNSWSNKWGNDGYFWIDYNFIEQCVIESYVIEF